MHSRRSSLFRVAAGLFAGLAAAGIFLLTAGEWIILSTHYDWCQPEACSDQFIFSVYAVVLAGCLVASVLAFWVTRKLIMRLQR